MNNTNPQTMLYTHSWFASKEYNLNNEDNNCKHLSISEASMNQSKSEKFPLDIIEATPQVANQFDLQLLAFTFICALASATFLTLAASENSLIISLLSGFFLLVTTLSVYVTFHNKVRSYTYFYADSDTPIFSLVAKQTDKVKVDQFINTLNRSIELSTQDNDIMSNDIKTVQQTVNLPANSEEQEYLAYTYHLDFLFASGLINNKSYLEVGHNISNRVFGVAQTKTASKPSNNSNIIHFPG